MCLTDSRPLEQVRAFSEEITRFLLGQGAGLIVVACNAASAAALHHLRHDIPGHSLCRHGTGSQTRCGKYPYRSGGRPGYPGHFPKRIICIGGRTLRPGCQGVAEHLPRAGRPDRKRKARRCGDHADPAQCDRPHARAECRYDRHGLHALPVRDPADQANRRGLGQGHRSGSGHCQTGGQVTSGTRLAGKQKYRHTEQLLHHRQQRENAGAGGILMQPNGASGKNYVGERAVRKVVEVDIPVYISAG